MALTLLREPLRVAPVTLRAAGSAYRSADATDFVARRHDEVGDPLFGIADSSAERFVFRAKGRGS